MHFPDYALAATNFHANRVRSQLAFNDVYSQRCFNQFNSYLGTGFAGPASFGELPLQGCGQYHFKIC